MILVFFSIVHAIKTVYYLFRDYKQFARHLMITFLLFSLAAILFSLLSKNTELLDIKTIDVSNNV
jgi:uncharacterized membrane protein